MESLWYLHLPMALWPLYKFPGFADALRLLGLISTVSPSTPTWKHLLSWAAYISCMELHIHWGPGPGTAGCHSYLRGLRHVCFLRQQQCSTVTRTFFIAVDPQEQQGSILQAVLNWDQCPWDRLYIFKAETCQIDSYDNFASPSLPWSSAAPPASVYYIRRLHWHWHVVITKTICIKDSVICKKRT
jgi:hypothetical protein